MKLYHGTTKKRAKKILKDGLEPRCPPVVLKGLRKKAVYLTDEKRGARFYAKLTAEREGSDPCVLEIDLASRDVKSGYHGREFCTTQKIPPSHIRVIE